MKLKQHGINGLTLVLVLCILGLSSSVHAKRHRKRRANAQAAAAPAAAVTPAVPTQTSITVTLKDGQVAGLKLITYDRFFLSAVNAKGTRFDIPWAEVATVDSPNAGGDLAMMRGNLNSDPEPVTMVIEPRSPQTAFDRALWPGVLLHGAGFRYAGNNDRFVGLAGAEFFGVVVGAFGTYLQLYPNADDTSREVPQALVTAGVVCFVGTWLWDLAFSPCAARGLDRSKGLALEPASRGEGLQLSYRY